MNVRDLGGLPTAGGGVTRWGAVVRSDHPAKLTASGWRALLEHGVRTIVTLRTRGIDESRKDAAPRPPELWTTSVEVEDAADPGFGERWIDTGLWSTPLYYPDALRRWPERHARAVEVVAHAPPGGVLIHCARGFDRTGLITIVLLSLAGVAPEDIAADYAMSGANMPAEERAALQEVLERERTTARKAVLAALDSFEAEAYLRNAGLDGATIEAARARLVERPR